MFPKFEKRQHVLNVNQTKKIGKKKMCVSMRKEEFEKLMQKILELDNIKYRTCFNFLMGNLTGSEKV